MKKKITHEALEELLFSDADCFNDNVLAKMLWYVGVSLTTYDDDDADVGDVTTLPTSLPSLTSKLLSLRKFNRLFVSSTLFKFSESQKNNLMNDIN